MLINNFLIYERFVEVSGIYAFANTIINAKIERKKKFHENKKKIILTEYDISCELCDICRRFSSIPDQAEG